MIRNSDYWLADKDPDLSNIFDFLKLQRAVANFVKIISGRDIPVEFQYHNDKSTIDKIIISADLSDIDATVGLAIHETISFIYSDRWCTSKIITLLTDDYLTSRHSKYKEIPVSQRYEYKKTIRSEIEGIYHLIEYWRLDDFTIETSSGYKGYIQATYNQIFNPNLTIELLNRQRNNYYRISYFFLFFALTADSKHYTPIIHTNIQQPQIKEKALLYYQLQELVDINQISRLKTSAEALELAINVWELIDEYATNILPEHLAPDEDSFQDKLDNEPDRIEESQSQSYAKEQFSRAGLDIPKKNISMERKNDLNHIISNSSSKYYTDYENRRIKVTVLNEMTRDLIYSGRYPFFNTESVHHTENAVKEGIYLGKQLARKIAFRNDHRQTRFSRLEQGRIDRRLLHSVSYGNNEIFYKSIEEPFPTVNFHISIDGSHSMSGNCFLRSLKTAVAIAQMADLVKNITVTISFRYFTNDHSVTLPLVLVAYDSQRDRLSKIKQLFRFLKATGPTPEGLCYAVITDLMNKKAQSAANTENHFINLFDGMPGFVIDNDCIYEGKPAIEHTRNEVLRMKRKGFNILSYFVIPPEWKIREVNETFEHFKYMYGKDAQMINLNALNELAKSLNRLLF